MKAKRAEPARKPAKRETADLDVRYGEIGISAVAAAMRYHRTAGKSQQGRDEDKERRQIPEKAA